MKKKDEWMNRERKTAH